jgi:hypothetical protein
VASVPKVLGSHDNEISLAEKQGASAYAESGLDEMREPHSSRFFEQEGCLDSQEPEHVKGTDAVTPVLPREGTLHELSPVLS